MFVEIQPEAEEAQALVWTVYQQHQEMLDDALRGERERRRGHWVAVDVWWWRWSDEGEAALYLVEVSEDSELGAHLWYGFLELLNPLVLLRFLFGRDSPLTLNGHMFNASIIPSFILFLKKLAHCHLHPLSYLLLPLLLLLLKLQSEGELLQGWAVQGVLGALELDDLVEYGPQLV